MPKFAFLSSLNELDIDEGQNSIFVDPVNENAGDENNNILEVSRIQWCPLHNKSKDKEQSQRTSLYN